MRRSTIFLLTICSVIVHTRVGFAASQAAQPQTDRPNSTQLLIKGSQLYIVDAQSQRLSVQQLERAATPQIAPVEKANTLWSGSPLDSPTGIATDNSEALYVADPRAKTIFVIRPGRGPEILFSGGPLEFPTGIAINKSRVFITDPGARSIFSLNLSTHEIYTEYHQSSGRFPEKIIWANRTLYAYSPETQAVIRLFSERDSSKSDPFFRGQSESWSVPSTDPTVVKRGEILNWKGSWSQAVDFGVAHDVVYLLDPTGRHISLLPLLGGRGVQLTLPESFGTASRIAVTDDLLCILTSRGIVSMQTVVPAVISYERTSFSSESSRLYAYLASKGLLRIGQDTGPESESAMHLLLEGPVRKVPSRELVELPLRKDSKTKPPAQFDGTLGQIAKELAPENTSEDDLKKSLSKLNYWYKGNNILGEKRGLFVVPSESAEVTVPLPVEAIINRQSAFYAALSADVTVDSPILYGGLVEQSVIAREKNSVEGGTLDAHPITDPNCFNLPTGDWTPALTLIHYCLPKDAPFSNVGVVERHVDTANPEFAPSSLKRYADETDSKPTQSDPQHQFNSEWDHGTHVAGLIGAHAHSHQVFGLHPKATIWGIRPADLSKALNSDPDGPDLSDLRVYNVSLGESDLNDPANQGVGINGAAQLKALIDNDVYVDKLFVVAAGDIQQPVPVNSLAATGLHSNVIVVGAATLSEPIGPSKHSRFGWENVDIFAPGENIVSALYGGGYASATGTSQSAAFVSGTAALLDSLEPAWPPWKIKQRILSSADLWTDGPNANAVRTGMLNVKAAVLHRSQAVIEFWVPPTQPSETSSSPGQQCIGRIQYAGVKGKLKILRPGQKTIEIQISQVRRLHRNQNDDTFTIFYTRDESNGQTIRLGNRIGLERLMGVQGSDLRGATKFDFISDDQNCTDKTTIGLTDLSEMINGFY